MGQAKQYVEGESCCWHCFNCTQYEVVGILILCLQPIKTIFISFFTLISENITIIEGALCV